MRPYDFSPLYRNFVGFDRMANMIDNAASQAAKSGTTYPPYNVARLSEDSYRIDLAVAGFTVDDIEIETHEGVLTVSGGQTPTAENDAVEYLHRGIAERGFERRFQLADHVRVSSADLTNGLLSISLVREVPEALRPQKIAINGGAPQSNLQSDGKLITAKSGKSRKAA
ncbi:MAG: Hsp20 family protein [Litorimonas sp.]